MKFIKFLGSCWLNGKGVAVFRDDDADTYTLKAQTTGLNPVKYCYTDEEEKTHWRTLKDMTLSASAYEQFCEDVSYGVHANDARIVQRSLIAMGYPEFE